jgi:acetyl esterase/lipase
MPKFTLFFLTIFIATAGFAFAGIETLVVPYTATEDVVYGQKAGMGLTFDVIQPENNCNGKGIILVSSGGWKSSKSNIPEKVAERRRDHWGMGLLSNGYTVFVVRHGTGPRFTLPEIVEDIRRSVRFIRLHAADYAIDPDNIGITSGSSGGHLALMVGTTGDDGNPEAADPVERVSSRTQAIVSWFPPTDLINWGREDGYQMIQKLRPEMFQEMFGTITDLEVQLKSISPIYHVTKDDPPLLLISGDKDLTVPVQQSEIMNAKYQEVGLDVKLIIQPGGGHTYWNGIEKHYVDVASWFGKYLD